MQLLDLGIQKKHTNARILLRYSDTQFLKKSFPEGSSLDSLSLKNNFFMKISSVLSKFFVV